MRQALYLELGAFLTAVRFLTRVPVPEVLFPRNVEPISLLRRAPPYFPLVGSLIGLTTGSVVLLAEQFWPAMLAVLLGLAFEAVLTGAFHEDAVADFCDAFGGGWTREDVLRILKDSRVGSFGALGLCLAVLLRAGALLATENRLLALAASATLGRWVALLVMAWLPPLSERESILRDVGERLSWRGFLLGCLLALPGTAALLGEPLRAMMLLAVLCLFAVFFVRYVRLRIGGVTGDCLGTACYAGQLIVLLALAARLSGAQ